MKVTNNKTNESYELSSEAADKLKKSKLGKFYTFDKPAPAPPELKAVQGDKPVKPAKVKTEAPAASEEQAS
jgi:hypothetical protein